MKKLTKPQIYAIVGGVMALSVITFVIIRRRKNKKLIKDINDILDAKVKDPNQTGTQTVLPPSEVAKLPVGNFPLAIGDKNQKVHAVQMALNRKFGSGIDADGKYGESTFVSMCKNLWNTKMYTTYETQCIDHSLGGRTRRKITQADWQELQKTANFDGSGFDGEKIGMSF